MKRSQLSAAIALALLACGGSGAAVDAAVDAAAADAEPPGCVDEDGDGAGVGTDCASHDCDDTDPFTTSECGTGCVERPERLGCPCASEEPLVCFHGPVEATGQGTCRAGIQGCVDGVRGACEGQVLPRLEQCDEQDDDCDGETDEGATSECGTCGECREGACFGAGDGCGRWSAGRLDHTVQSANESLTLVRLNDEDRVLWPTASQVSVRKVDPATLAILATYLTSDDYHHNIRGTAVDRDGNLVVAHLRGSWVTRIARSEADCVDRNGNGVIDTSHAADDALAFGAPDDWDDECVLWHAQVREGASTVALHESYGLDSLVERAWIGNEQAVGSPAFVELDLDTGEATGREVDSITFEPRGTAVDREGRIWTTGATDALGVFDPADPEPEIELHASEDRLLRVTVDRDGYPWVNGTGLRRFDPATEEFDEVFEDWELEQGVAPNIGQLAADGAGSVWMLDYLPSAYRVDIATLEWEVVDFGSLLSAYIPMELGFDFLRQAWVLVWWIPGASIYDLDTGEVSFALDDCGREVCSNVAQDCEDFTGLPWAIVQPERGVWTDQTVACADTDEVDWAGLRASATIPDGSRVSLMVRTGVGDADLWNGAWILAGRLTDGDNVIDLHPVLGEATRLHRALALQARLEADRGAESPVLSGVEVSWGCRRIE